MVSCGEPQARIIIPNAFSIELRDMLNKHIAQNVQNFPMNSSAK